MRKQQNSCSLLLFQRLLKIIKKMHSVIQGVFIVVLHSVEVEEQCDWGEMEETFSFWFLTNAKKISSFIP